MTSPNPNVSGVSADNSLVVGEIFNGPMRAHSDLGKVDGDKARLDVSSQL